MSHSGFAPSTGRPDDLDATGSKAKFPREQVKTPASTAK
jgi:hypothetical protein